MMTPDRWRSASPHRALRRSALRRDGTGNYFCQTGNSRARTGSWTSGPIFWPPVRSLHRDFGVRESDAPLLLGPSPAPIGEARRTSTGGVPNSKLTRWRANEESKALDRIAKRHRTSFRSLPCRGRRRAVSAARMKPGRTPERYPSGLRLRFGSANTSIAPSTLPLAELDQATTATRFCSSASSAVRGAAGNCSTVAC